MNWEIQESEEQHQEVHEKGKRKLIGERVNSVVRLSKIWGRTTVRGHANSWKTWPPWNEEKLLLSRTVQENASQKNERCWTDGQNTAPSCTIQGQCRSISTGPASWQTQRMTTPSFEKKWRRTITEEREVSWSRRHPSKTAGGEDVITALTTICNKIWQTGEWPTPWTQSIVITLPKKGNLQQCQNYRAISLISHPSKVIMKIILNILKKQLEKIIAEEQAGFSAGKSIAQQIFNLRI